MIDILFGAVLATAVIATAVYVVTGVNILAGVVL